MCFLLTTFVPIQIYTHLSIRMCSVKGHKECRSILVKLHPITIYRTVFWGVAQFLCWMPLLFSLVYQLFLPLHLHSEYRIQHSAIRPLCVTFSYSTWIFCRGFSGFANARFDRKMPYPACISCHCYNQPPPPLPLRFFFPISFKLFVCREIIWKMKSHWY